MKTNQNITKIICEIGIFSAIGFILDELQSVLFKGIFVNGGSIGFAMIVVLIIGYRRGFFASLITGFIIGLFDLATGAYIIHPAQLLLDYLLPYVLVAFGTFFKNPYFRNNKSIYLILGALVGGVFKFLSHYLSGVIFWADQSQFAWGLTYLTPYLYSFLYNFAFIGPSILLTSLLMVAINKKGKRILIANENQPLKIVEEKEIDPKHIVASLITLFLGAFLFIFFLIKYIQSYSSSNNSYSFSKDSMLIFIIGLFLLIIGIVSFINAIKKRFDIKLFCISYILICLFSTIFAITQTINCSQKGLAIYPYIIWMVISVLILISFLLIFKLYRNKK